MFKNIFQQDGQVVKTSTKLLFPELASKVPSNWTAFEVARMLSLLDPTLVEVSRQLLSEQIDGPAFLLLDLPSLIGVMKIKWGPAVKIISILGRIKVAFAL